jgi:hypothetical protein
MRDNRPVVPTTAGARAGHATDDAITSKVPLLYAPAGSADKTISEARPGEDIGLPLSSK